MFDLSTLPNAIASLNKPGYFKLNLAVTDPADKQFLGDRSVPTPKADGPKLCCWLDKAFYPTNETIICHTANQTSSDQLYLEVVHLNDTSNAPLQTIQLAQSDATLKPLPGGAYAIQLSNESGETSQPFQFAVIDEKENGLTEDNPIRLITEKSLYRGNDVVRLLIQVDRPGRYVYWFPRAIDQLGLSKPMVFHMDTTSKVVELKLDKEVDKGIIQSAALTIVNERLYTKENNITILSPELDTGTLELTPDHQIYNPAMRSR